MLYFMTLVNIVILAALLFTAKTLWSIANVTLVSIISNLEMIRVQTIPKPPGPVPPKPGGRVKLKVKNPEDIDNGLDDWIP